MVDYRRRSGLILHLTSLPSKYGIGDLGENAYRWIDLLKKNHQTLWQILPMGPVHVDGCPYTSLSAFAGNAFVIDVEDLVKRKLLKPSDLKPLPEGFNDYQARYDLVNKYKIPLLRKAFENFKPTKKFKDFKNENKFWLEDWCLFETAAEEYETYDWPLWPASIRDRNREALARYKKNHAEDIEFHSFVQFIFFEQWFALKNYANKKGVRIVGDIPIFVSLKSADVWSRAFEFNLDAYKRPATKAGCPPDAFSASGQMWGMPHYRWDLMQQNDFKWWMERFDMCFKMYDTTRVDHFRAFEAYWAIPQQEDDPRYGYWVKVPGYEFFYKLKERFGDVDIIVEDLGTITPEVYALRDRFHFPGMKVLQLSFAPEDEEKDLPHNQPTNCVAYTGTHDNLPIRSWYFDEATPHIRWLAKQYCHGSDHNIHWDLTKVVMQSRADKAIMQIQDILGYGHDARMNVPGKDIGNWSFRIKFEDIKAEIMEALKALTVETGREAL